MGETKRLEGRAQAIGVLEETFEGEDAHIPTRDRAFHHLIETSVTREEWAETVEFLRVARRVEFEDAKGNTTSDLRPGVRDAFVRACREAGYDDLIVYALIDEPRKPNLPPVTIDMMVDLFKAGELFSNQKPRASTT